MKNRAFTLIELLITVALIALLASFTVPVFQILITQEQLSSAADQVVGLLRNSEQNTVTQQKIYGVTFAANAVTIPQFLCTNGNCTSGKVAQGAYNLPANIIISQVNFSGSSDVSFTTSGAPSVSGSLVLMDTSRNRRRTIQVQPSVAIQDNSPEF